MKSKYVLLIFLIILSAIATAYSLFLTLNFQYSGLSFGKLVSERLMKYPYLIFPLLLATFGWLISGYELFTIRKKSISRVILKEVSGKGDGWALYNTFKGKGGARRLAMMEILETPMIRSEIADIVGMDWKEVDRNIKILESVDLVKTQYSHGSTSVFELTNKGKNVLEKVKSAIG